MSNDREEQRRRNREAAPELAALLDEFKEQFPDAKLIWGKDYTTGAEFGKKPENENVFTIPPNYFPTQQIDTRQKRGRR